MTHKYASISIYIYCLLIISWKINIILLLSSSGELFSYSVVWWGIVHEPSATDPEAEENNMFSTNISFWPKKKKEEEKQPLKFVGVYIAKDRHVDSKR